MEAEEPRKLPRNVPGKYYTTEECPVDAIRSEQASCTAA